MPYVPTEDALNQPLSDLVDLARQAGPLVWRQPLVGSDRCRIVLWQLPAGDVPHPPHRHPDADETMIVLRGNGAFLVGDGPEFEAGPMTAVYAPRGVTHGIRVPGPDPLLFIAVVAPNLDEDEETV